MPLSTAQLAFVPVLAEGTTNDCYPVGHITNTRDTWVKLLRSPSEYAGNEAKLLCQAEQDSWVVWVPDHGEAVLNRSDFYC